ncbi:MAG UNVERIFIED_CONTAM: hypothetical protein LVR29_06760 [Microcystis novacekii LVE1205-3]|jgi:phosphate transport system ATP-binding protein
MTTHLNPDHSVFDAEGVKVFYNGFLALVDVHIKIPARKIVAFIGRLVAAKVPSCAALTE